jgi:uncharacterized protein YcbK (DUF882 family)
MLRLVVFGVVTTLTLSVGSRAARAQGEASEASDTTASPADQADDGTEAPAEVTRPSPKAGGKQHGDRHGRRGHRHPLMSGRVVLEDNLRQGPLPHPSGDLHLVFPGVKDDIEVNIYNDDGSYNLEALAEASHLLRCRRTDTERPMDPQLLMLLSHVYDHFGKKPLEIVSGYRNQRKKTSNHYKGAAADIRIAGVSPKKVREFAETLDGGGMGIGFYPKGGFVHIDVRPPPSYRWIDYSPPGSNESEKRPPRGWKRKKLQT